MAVRQTAKPLQDQRTTVQNRPAGGGYGGFQTPTTGTNRPPAWLGRSPFSGSQAGGGQTNYSPANQNWQEPMQNTGNTDRRTLEDNANGGGPVMNNQNMLPGNSNVNYTPSAPTPQWFQRPPAYGGTYNPTVTNPAMQPGQGQRPPAYGGSYNPTSTNPAFRPLQVQPQRPPAYGGHYDPTVNNPAMQVPEWMTNLGYTPPTPDVPVTEVPTYPASSTRPPGGFMLPQTVAEQPATGGGGGGFGTTYGGNWRRGRGGYGGGGYGGYGGGGGGGDYPAWMNTDMGLYSWKFGQ